MMPDKSIQEISETDSVVTGIERCARCGKTVPRSRHRIEGGEDNYICDDCYQHMLSPTGGEPFGPMSG